MAASQAKALVGTSLVPLVHFEMLKKVFGYRSLILTPFQPTNSTNYSEMDDTDPQLAYLIY